jgi:hypothetical protein
LAAIESMTTRCLVMERGKIIADEAPAAAIRRYTQMQEQPSDQALGAYRNRGAGRQRLLDIHCIESRGRVRDAFKPKEPVTIRFFVESPDLGEWDLAFAIEDWHGVPLFASHLTDRNPAISRRGKLAYEVTIDPNYLRQGSYLMSCGIYSPDRSVCHDEILHYPVFRIEGQADGVPMADERWGAMYFPFAWSEAGVL